MPNGPLSLTGAERAFVRTVWEEYKQFSASGLWKKTHSEAPWQQARAGCQEDEKSNEEITQEALLDFFAPLAQEREREFGVSPQRVWDAIDQFDRNGGRPHKEVFARLRGE